MLSTLASQPHAITEVAKPVIVVAACAAQRSVGAVITIAVARMSNASANVSSMSDSVDRQLRHATASNGCGRAIAPSGTRMKSEGRP